LPLPAMPVAPPDHADEFAIDEPPIDPGEATVPSASTREGEAIFDQDSPDEA